MIENDFTTSASLVLDHDLQEFPQRSYSSLSTSALFNCCHSARQSQSLGCAVNNFPQAHLLIAVHWKVFVSCFCSTCKNCSRASNVGSFAMHCPRKRLSARTRANQDLDFCTLLTVLDRRAASAVALRGCVAVPRTLRHVSHLGSNVACPVTLVIGLSTLLPQFRAGFRAVRSQGSAVLVSSSADRVSALRK